MLRFSANLSLLFCEHDLPARFAAARAAGFTAVEIQFPYDLDTATLKRLLAESGQQLVLINVPAGDLMAGGDGLAGVPGREQAFRDALATALRYAEALSVPTLNLLAGRQPPGVERARCMDVLAQNCAQAVTACSDIGVKVVVEAINPFDMPRFLLHSLDPMQELCAQVDGLKMQFDCYHMQRTDIDVVAALRTHIGDIGHIQFADVPGRHEPGSGDMDYPAIFSLLQQLPYAGWCGAEYRPSRRTEETLAWRLAALQAGA